MFLVVSVLRERRESEMMESGKGKKERKMEVGDNEGKLITGQAYKNRKSEKGRVNMFT